MKTRMTLTALVALLSMVLLTASSAHAATTVVADENFDGGSASGWNDNKVETSNPGGNFTAGFLGRHQGLESQQLYKTFTIPSGIVNVNISFDFYEVDSWDNENFRVYIDDTQVFARNFQHGSNEALGGGMVSNGSNSNKGFGSWSDQFHGFSFDVTPTGTSIKLGFGAFLNGGESDESMGIDNVYITASDLPPASLTFDASVEISDNHSVFNLSVFPGKAGYDDGVDSSVLGDGTVLDYRFFNSDGATFNGTGYADGGAGLVSTATATNSNGTNGGALNWADVWTTNDPDADPADFTTDTVARSQGVVGTVDISGLESGQLYFIHGTFDDPSTVILTMTGADQPDRIVQHTENPGGVNKAWITSFDFADAALYDTISWTYINSDTDASRARFMGVILDGQAPTNAIPEPMTMLAVGLGISGLGGYIRKRRRA